MQLFDYISRRGSESLRRGRNRWPCGSDSQKYRCRAARRSCCSIFCTCSMLKWGVENVALPEHLSLVLERKQHAAAVVSRGGNGPRIVFKIVVVDFNWLS